MGGGVSTGRNNDDLVDNLLDAWYIKSSIVERVFRAVDRAEYFLPEARSSAYKDLAWKSGNLHLSAPCIYSEVMEALNLEPGLSFLNLGSGTGYLSTMAGLMLGSNGHNHGIEIHEDVVEYANKKLEDFKRYSGAVDEFDFCEPKFVTGNCLCLSIEGGYDRVYCGAACSEQHLTFLRNLIKVGGVLVLPLNEQLVKIQRVSESEWVQRSLLPVSFTTLIAPLNDQHTLIRPFEKQPASLMIICRAVIRNILRRTIDREFASVKRSAPVRKGPKKKRALRRLAVPPFESDESSDEETHVRYRRNIFTAKSTTQNRRTDTQDESMETDSTEETSANNTPNSYKVRAIIEHHRNGTEEETHEGERDNNDDDDDNEDDDEDERKRKNRIRAISEVIVECLNVIRSDREEEEEVARNNDEPSTSNNKRWTKREKFDSGLGDEIIETQDSADEHDIIKLDAISSCDEDSTTSDGQVAKVFGASSDNDSDDDTEAVEGGMRMYRSQYTDYFQFKIEYLPLPKVLKRFLNFYRDF